MKLYNANFSPNALRVRAVALELGIDLEIIEVNIRGGDNLPWLVRNTPKKSLRVFLQSGENDLDNTHGCWPLANQTLARALAYAGYEHRFVFGKGWHSRIQGAHHLPVTLTWLLGGEQAPPSL